MKQVCNLGGLTVVFNLIALVLNYFFLHSKNWNEIPFGVPGGQCPKQVKS